MQITKIQRGDFVEVRISGRLDGYWADHLTTGLAEVVREGGHQIRVNLSEVSFLSSAGIRVLVQFFKQLRAIDGSLAVCNPSEHVSQVLDLAGLRGLLISTDDTVQAPVPVPSPVRRVDRETVGLEVFPLPGQGQMRCHTIGDPSGSTVAALQRMICARKRPIFPRHRSPLDWAPWAKITRTAEIVLASFSGSRALRSICRRMGPTCRIISSRVEPVCLI